MPRPDGSLTFTEIAWIAVPLSLGIVAIEIGSISITAGTEPVLSTGEIICGVALILIVVRAMMQRGVDDGR